MEVHEHGMATVTVACKRLVEEYSQKLQRMGLTVSIAPDNEFASSDSDEDLETFEVGNLG